MANLFRHAEKFRSACGGLLFGGMFTWCRYVRAHFAPETVPGRVCSLCGALVAPSSYRALWRLSSLFLVVVLARSG